MQTRDGGECGGHRQIAERARGEQLYEKRQDVDDSAMQVWGELVRDGEALSGESVSRLHSDLVAALHFVEDELTELLDEEDRPEPTLLVPGEDCLPLEEDSDADE